MGADSLAKNMYPKCHRIYLPNLSAQAQNFWILMKKSLHWASVNSPWFEFLIHLHISYKPRCLNCIEEKTCSLSPILCVRVGSRSATLSPRWLLKTVFKVHTSLDIYFPFSDQGLFCKVPNILMKSVTLYHFLSCLQYQLFKSPILLTNPCWKWSMDISWY